MQPVKIVIGEKSLNIRHVQTFTKAFDGKNKVTK